VVVVAAVLSQAPLVPLVYRAIGTDPEAIGTAQAVIAIVAWSVLAVGSPPSSRQACEDRGGRVTALFVLAPSRVGYTHVSCRVDQ